MTEIITLPRFAHTPREYRALTDKNRQIVRAMTFTLMYRLWKQSVHIDIRNGKNTYRDIYYPPVTTKDTCHEVVRLIENNTNVTRLEARLLKGKNPVFTSKKMKDFVFISSIMTDHPNGELEKKIFAHIPKRERIVRFLGKEINTLPKPVRKYLLSNAKTS